ncbi:hypothetical protein PR202_ga12016 [Eleusine coracana subsp. coracana]|uniref:Uncharacterized protein n=1 Tax=Eleusine coracana subsp. coracana TaxID=191504 RepID=A0AAV5CB14_ELECO|nr:hypothetical protein PR202_ga12016 [Eleusine coracana subsp. coracana]
MTDELKASRYVIQDLESELVRSIKSNDQSLELIHKRDMEISRLNSELDILNRREYLVTEEHKIQTLQLYDAEDSPLSAKLKRIEASLEKARDLNTRYQQDLESHSSAEEEKDEVRHQAEVETVKVITSLHLQLNASKKNELLAKENLEELQLEKNRLNDRLGKVMEENERFSSVNYELSTDNSLLQSKLTRNEEVAKALSFDLRMIRESASIAKDKADELIKVKESVILLEQELASKSEELDDVVSDRQQFKDQIMKNNGRVAALEKELAKKIDELDMISSENAELKSQLKRTERISPIVEELAHRSKFTGKLEEELRSLQNELSKLSDEKHSCEAQLLFFKDKLEMAQALTAESESITTKAQQIVKEKNNEIKLLERSVEDLEITVCELENKVSIVKEEAKHEKMQREELELKLQSIRQQKSVMQSSGNASSSLKDEMVSLVDSMRHSQDKQNELLDAQEVSKSEQEVLGPVQKGCASCMTRGKQCVGMTQPFEELMQGVKASNGECRANGCSSGDTWNGSTNASFPYSHALPKTTNQTKPTVQATESPTVGAEPAPLTEDPDELSKESSLVEGLQELKETDDEMEDTHSLAEDYRPKISEFDQTSPNEHLHQYSGSEQPELHKVGVVSDQSQSESRSEEQLPSPFVGPVVEIIEENELPPFAPMRHNDPVNYMRAPSDELKRLRSRNHYDGAENSNRQEVLVH